MSTTITLHGYVLEAMLHFTADPRSGIVHSVLADVLCEVTPESVRLVATDTHILGLLHLTAMSGCGLDIDCDAPTAVVLPVREFATVLKDRRYPTITLTIDGLWPKIGVLLNEGRFITSREVYNELSTYEDDVVFQWLKARTHIVREFDEQQTVALASVLSRCPQLVESRKLKPYHADPWVIALAIAEQQQQSLFSRQIAVLTHEIRSETPKKIPYVCRQFGVCCFSLLEMFEREGWKF